MIQTQTASTQTGEGALPTGLPKAPHHRHPGPAKAASTARNLRYADPRSLPSFPSYGLSCGGAAASAAASLGWSNQKPVELWRPDKTASASAAAVLARGYDVPSPWEPVDVDTGAKAAFLARGYKMPPPWEPVADESGAKAAVLAVGSADAALKESCTADAKDDGWGNTAANQAFHANRPIIAETKDQEIHLDGHQWLRKAALPLSPPPPSDNPPITQDVESLAAAKGAMSESRQTAAVGMSSREKVHASQRRSRSIDASTVSSRALDGAARAHRRAARSVSVVETGAIPVTTMSREMFTSHPPVKLEMDEMANNERLHQSAVEMAKRMYQKQQRQGQVITAEAAAAATTSTMERERGLQGASDVASPVSYPNLQDAAYRQAQERLAKLQDKHQKDREFREYYGKEQTQGPRRRFSLMARLRRRSSSEAELADGETSTRMRQQTSIFSAQPSRVDPDKRDKDREAVTAAAQRNVKSQLQDMDDKVLQETGRLNPTVQGVWEERAQSAAETNLQSRKEREGRIYIGGGKYMRTDEVDAIAERRVRPVLDDIEGTAGRERERRDAEKSEKEAKKDENKRVIERERERRAMFKRFQEEDKKEEKARKLREKQEEKARKEEAKRQRKEEKRRLKINTNTGAAATAAAADTGHVDTTGENGDTMGEHVDTARDNINTTGEHGDTTEDHGGDTGQGNEGAESPSGEDMTGETRETTSPQRSTAHQGPRSPLNKVAGWFRNRLSRGKRGSSTERDSPRGFVGGAALRAGSREDDSSSTVGQHRSAAVGAGSREEGSTLSVGQHRSPAVGGGEEASLAGARAGSGSVGDDGVAGSSERRNSLGRSPLRYRSSSEIETMSGRGLSLEPPRQLAQTPPPMSGSPARDSRFREEMEMT